MFRKKMSASRLDSTALMIEGAENRVSDVGDQVEAARSTIDMVKSTLEATSVSVMTATKDLGNGSPLKAQ